MFEDIKIFIPTKGRLNNQKTYNLLRELNLNPTLVIEPQEENEAFEKGYNFIILPDNNKGISYSRNYILNYARINQFKYICMLDDDISQFGFIENKKRVPDNKAFLKALEYFKESKTCGTIQYNQFAWCQPKPIVYNRGLEVVFFLYMPLLNNVMFEEDTIEDRDFSLDIILNHKVKTFRLNHLYFNVPSIGTNKGGIESSNRYQKQIEWSQKMEKKWTPEICKYIIKKNGMPDIKINWRNVDKLLNKTIIQLKFPLYPESKVFIFDNPPKYEQLQFPFMKEFV